MPMSGPNILLLGGSGEAFAIAEALGARAGWRVVTSLAGRTRERRTPAGELRIGGFGGAAGLAQHLVAEEVTALVDATHPFAATMSRNAAAAAECAGVPLLRVERPAWAPVAGDRWIGVSTMAEAAQAIPQGASPTFLTVGRTELAAFAERVDIRFIARAIDLPEADPGIPGLEMVFARGPFDLGAERAFIEQRGLRCIVAKNAGGEGARAKLDAARLAGLPVVMVRRPPPAGGGETVATATEALDWLERRFGGGSR